ncbi:MAG TPA: transcriptional regulator [Ignavibacteria bacterium]|nr:transcriptional regulator [Ignavibacteria bacterium]HMR41385.1 transcriptional regulator [Ignavibacteria bacterium]
MRNSITDILTRLKTIDKHFQGSKPVKTSILAARLDVSEKTIYRDLKFLESEYNAPVEYDFKSKSYHYTKPFKFNPVDLTISELYNLAIIRKLIKSSSSNPFKTGQKSLFKKLTMSFGEDIWDQIRMVKEKVSFKFKPVRIHDEKLFKVIEKALFNEISLRIDYFMIDKNTAEERIADPYHMRCHEGNWYLIGYSHKENKVRMFAVNRIKKAKLTNRTFDIPDNFNIKDYFIYSFGKRRTSRIYNVKFEVRQNFANQILESEIHTSQILKKLPNGNIRVTLKVSDLSEIKEWILSKGSGLVVKSPPELIKMITEESKSILNSYK